MWADNNMKNTGTETIYNYLVLLLIHDLYEIIIIAKWSMGHQSL